MTDDTGVKPNTDPGAPIPPSPPAPPAPAMQEPGVVIRPVSQGASAGPEAAPPQWWKRRGAVVSMAIGVAVVVAAIVLAVVLGSGSPDPGSDAASQDRRSTRTGSGGGAPLDMDTSVSTTAAGGDTAAAPAPEAAPGGTEVSGGAGTGGGGVPGGPAVLVPRPGPYTYTGSGTEKTTPFLPNPVTQGPTKPATVSDAGGGCWLLSMTQYDNQNGRHVDGATFCAGGDGSLTLKSIMIQRSNSLGALGKVDSTLTTTCPAGVVVVAPTMAPGAQFPLQCSVHTETNPASAPIADSSATGTTTFVGVENVSVGGTAVAAYHLHQDVRLVPGDGAPEGSRKSDLWIATDDGMVLREVRSMTASAKLFGQVSTYSETSEHVLTGR